MPKLTVLDIKCSVARDRTYLTLTSKLIDADLRIEMSAHSSGVRFFDTWGQIRVMH